MSIAMTSSSPAAFATPTAPTTPAAGPESRVRTGWLRATATLISPPLDCMMRIGAGQPISSASVSSCLAIRSIRGITYAFITVVVARSYSRNSGETSQDRETGTSGTVAAMAARSLRSWAGWRKENRQHTATASNPPRAIASAIRPASSSARGVTTSPPAPMRSCTSKRWRRGTSGGGLRM